MGNRFYDPGEQRATKVNRLFDQIAPRYDLINDLQSFGLHRWWKRQVVRLAGVQAGDAALDVCTGTGDLAQALSRAGASVYAVDFSHQMLRVAECRTQPSALPHPAFVRADALRLPFKDNCFNAVTVGYGLRNLKDWRAGVFEMARVAKPGGRILILDFGKPENRLWRSLYYAYLRAVVPIFGLLFCGNADAYAYIFESLVHYPAQHGVAQCMREIGLDHVRIVRFLGGMMTVNYGEKVR